MIGGRDTVVCLFDDSGNLFDDWIEVGYKVLCVDVIPLEMRVQRDGVTHLVGDLRFPFNLPIEKDKVAFVSAHPPCDNLAVSGARWFKGKGLRALSESISMFATAAEYCDQSGAPYMIENPISSISSYWRKPDHIYSPWQYSGYDGDDYYTKKTCLWTGGGFVMPPYNYDESRYKQGCVEHKLVRKKYGSKSGKLVQSKQPNYPDARIHMATGEMQDYLRSVTPKGFGRAVFLSNCEAADFSNFA